MSNRSCTILGCCVFNDVCRQVFRITPESRKNKCTDDVVAQGERKIRQSVSF